jgi:hypothetical protein
MWWTLFAVLVFYVFLVPPFRQVQEKKRRAELQLLDMVRHQTHSHLLSGGDLPTNWAGFSNVLEWEAVTNFCGNYLPPLTELCTVLPRPVDFDSYHRSIFLVRSEPCWSGTWERGRWVLGICFRWPGNVPPDGDSNRTDRTWIPERYLPPEVRSQLAARVKK